MAEPDYPRTMEEFQRRFATEEACRQYLVDLRWPEGFRCPGCSGTKAWLTRDARLHCAGCGRQTSATAGTIFHRTRKPLRLWFQVIWWLVAQKNGASALGLQRVLGLGSYETAWSWLHKLRRAMVRPGRERLSGEVEVDESFVGGFEPGGGRRHIGKKALVGIAAEIRGKAIGRIRLACLPDGSAESLVGFVRQVVEPGSTVVTDGFESYGTIGKYGYRHRPRVIRRSRKGAEKLLPHVHRVASLLKRWLLGTHHGRVERSHLPYYLDEFTFRFNRRTSRSRGLLFHRLMSQAAAMDPVPFQRLVGGAAWPTTAGRGNVS